MVQTAEVTDDFRVKIIPKLPWTDSITVPHNGRNLVVAYLIYGPANALGLLRDIEIDNQKLIDAGSDLKIRQAQMGEVIPVVSPAYRRETSGDEDVDRIAGEITSTMDERYVRAATGVLYHPDAKLVYFVPNPKFDDRSIVDTADLVRRVESEKEEFATAPFSEIRGGARDLNDLEGDTYVLGFADGQEGVHKAISIGKKTPARQAYLYLPDVSRLKSPEGRIAVLGVDNAFRLGVYGLDHGNGRLGCAFGVLESTGEATHA